MGGRSIGVRELPHLVMAIHTSEPLTGRSHTQNAVSVFIRLGFAHRKMATDFSLYHESWKAKDTQSGPLRTARVSNVVEVSLYFMSTAATVTECL